MATKAEVQARHGVVNGSPPTTTVAVMDGEAMATGENSASPPEAPRLAAQIAPDMADYELKPAPVDPLTALRNSVDALDRARFAARQARSDVLASREAFNLALGAWNLTQPIQTVEDLKKEWIRSNQAERERKAAAGQLRRPTTVGQMAKALAGGGHNIKRGGGASYRRGAVGKAEAMEINANRLRAATLAAKLPSSR